MTDRKPDFFERPATRKALWALLYGVCAATLLAQLVVPLHPHFPFADIFGFNALLGFVACAVLILVSKALGMVLKKRTDYYER